MLLKQPHQIRTIICGQKGKYWFEIEYNKSYGANAGGLTKKKKKIVLLLYVKWKDKREVLTIPNVHVVEMVKIFNYNGTLSMNPNIIRNYNQGIDRSDQILSYYTALRKNIPPAEKKTASDKAISNCTKAKKRRETHYFCSICQEKPALYVEDYF
ncbi:PiggyBac transposable element-derived protein 4 [Vespula squamosa]|uniref:PiggyBac transposable element-derived protein 4 n=1 Tax=Vespula squamosa TaxID=30214 RepID=A0ABD2BS68_VESSQ